MSGFTQRALRRETHSSRSVLSIVAAVLVTAAAIYCLLELVLAALGEPSWVAHPLDSLTWFATLPGEILPLMLIAAGVVLVLVGLIFLAHGLLPGRRARHVLVHPRVAIVVDDEVIASALARCARRAAGITREQVVVVVSARMVQVNIRPTSGIRLSESTIQAAVEAELAQMGLTPAPAVTVKLAENGVVGV